MWPQRLLLLLLGLSAASAGVYVSRRRGENRRLLGVSPAETLSGADFTKCQLTCLQRGDCRSFNFNPQLGQCQLFTVTACDSHSYYVQQELGWTWYDVASDLGAESSQALWQQEACERDGRCRDSCLRHLGQNCRHLEQCQHLITGDVQCSAYVCRCDADRWQYNTTLCLRSSQTLTTDGYSWLWKKLVGGICEVEFDLKVGGDVRITASEQYTLSANRYVFSMSSNQADVRRKIGDNNQLIQKASVSLLSSTVFHTYTISWCSGKLRLRRSDRTQPYLSWNDPSPFSPTHIAVWSELDVRARVRFLQGLVDPWFGDDWSSQRVYSLPPDTALTRARAEQDFWVEFECRIAADCQWIARQDFKWESSSMWKVILGGWFNTASAIQRYTKDQGWSDVVKVSTPSILSATEFRRFRLHFSPAKISVYRADEPQPFMAHTVSDPFTISFEGPHMCCNTENVDFRLVAYDAHWSHEAGFTWGHCQGGCF